MSTAAPALIREAVQTHRRCPKGHLTAEEIKGAVDFFDKIENEYGDIIVEEYAKREKRLAYERGASCRRLGGRR